MKIKLLSDYQHMPGVIFPAGSVAEMADVDGQPLVDAGVAIQVDDTTAARIDPTGYVMCHPPDPTPPGSKTKK